VKKETQDVGVSVEKIFISLRIS